MLAMGLLLCSCASNKPQVEETPQSPPLKLVGIVASVPAERTFVLIQGYGTWDTPAGTILTTRGMENRTANLLFTGERLGRFAAADIQSGTVEKGDAVYSQHVPKPEAASPEPDGKPHPKPAATETPAAENDSTAPPEPALPE